MKPAEQAKIEAELIAARDRQASAPAAKPKPPNDLTYWRRTAAVLKEPNSTAYPVAARDFCA